MLSEKLAIKKSEGVLDTDIINYKICLKWLIQAVLGINYASFGAGELHHNERQLLWQERHVCSITILCRRAVCITVKWLDTRRPL
jgi:hypothetical protein